MNEYLTFDDVLILPNYSKFGSRKDTNISFSYKGLKLAIPILSAPMDTVTGWSMAVKMAKLGGLGILHRFCSIEENVNLFIDAKDALDTITIDEISLTSNGFEPGFSRQYAHKLLPIGVSVGTSESERERIDALYEVGAKIFCVDVAHGHSKVCGDTVKYIKSKYHDAIVIAGSVATKVGTDYLVGCGADIIRVGIGGGCFVGNTTIYTDEGPKCIEDIQTGDRVKTHNNTYQRVEEIHKRWLNEDEKLFNINGNICTANHEFLVVPKSIENDIDFDNYLNFSSWVPSEFLDPELHLLVELD